MYVTKAKEEIQNYYRGGEGQISWGVSDTKALIFFLIKEVKIDWFIKNIGAEL